MPADRRAPLNRDRVLCAAISLVDQDGIESLSMRKLGQALGVEAMSLYNHVASKDEILDGIADHVLSEIDLPATNADWEEAIWRCGISAHDTLAAHPWACTLIMSIPRLLPARLRYIEAVLSRPRQSHPGLHALGGWPCGQRGYCRRRHGLRAQAGAGRIPIPGRARRTAPGRHRTRRRGRVRVRAPADRRRPEENAGRALTGCRDGRAGWRVPPASPEYQAGRSPGGAMFTAWSPRRS
jgi:AcrR family transcriptional regulator